MKKSRIASKNKSIIACIGIGLATSILISLILTIVTASLIQKGSITESEKISVFLVRLVSVMVGSLVGTGLQGKKALPVIGVISGCYYICLLIVGLLVLNGSLISPWQGLLSTTVGGAVACVIKLKPQNTRKKTMRLAK